MVVSATPRKITSGAAAKAANSDAAHLKHKRRFCREEGCNRIVKSQGLCQRHGAKVRQCIVEGCNKGAQGNFDKMCKSHFKQMKRQTTPLPKVVPGNPPPPAEGKSVYDEVLPNSITFTARRNAVMPLIAHLKAGFDSLKPPAWHRNEERRARGMHTIENPAMQLEGWERELVWMEILVLTGAPGASFRHLARAWGRDKGFHMVLAQFICERQGDVQRKKRIAEKEEAAMKSRGPAKKRRRLTKSSQSDTEVSADIWDGSAYRDAITNEAFAADIFDFSAQEFESATAHQRWRLMGEAANSDTASIASQGSDADRKIKAKRVPFQIPTEPHPETMALGQRPVGNQYHEDATHLHQQPLQGQLQYVQHAQAQYLAPPQGSPEAQFATLQDQPPVFQQQKIDIHNYGQQQHYSQLHDNQNPEQEIGQPNPQYTPTPAPGRYLPPQQALNQSEQGLLHFHPPDHSQHIEPKPAEGFRQVPPPLDDARPEHPEQNPETSALAELSHPTVEYSVHQNDGF